MSHLSTVSTWLCDICHTEAQTRGSDSAETPDGWRYATFTLKRMGLTASTEQYLACTNCVANRYEKQNLFVHLWRWAKSLVVTLTIGLLSQGCAAGVFAVHNALSQESEAAWQEAYVVKIRETVRHENYNAVSVETGEVLCYAGDRECHATLARKAFHDAALRSGRMPQ